MSTTASMDQHLANMTALRAIVGPEPREQDLVNLLRKYPSVNQAANALCVIPARRLDPTSRSHVIPRLDPTSL